MGALCRKDLPYLPCHRSHLARNWPRRQCAVKSTPIVPRANPRGQTPAVGRIAANFGGLVCEPPPGTAASARDWPAAESDGAAEVHGTRQFCTCLFCTWRRPKRHQGPKGWRKAVAGGARRLTYRSVCSRHLWFSYSPARTPGPHRFWHEGRLQGRSARRACAGPLANRAAGPAAGRPSNTRRRSADGSGVDQSHHASDILAYNGPKTPLDLFFSKGIT